MTANNLIYRLLVPLALCSVALVTPPIYESRAVYAEETQSQVSQAFPKDLVGTWQYTGQDANGQTITRTLVVNEDGSFKTDSVLASGQITTNTGTISNVEAVGVNAYKFVGGNNTKYFGFDDSHALEGKTTGFVLHQGVLYLQLWSAGSESTISYDYHFNKVPASNAPSGEVMPFPTDLVGTWTGTYQLDVLKAMTLTIGQDGKVTKVKEYVDGNVERQTFTIKQVQKVGDNLYRLVDADGYFSEIADLSSLGGKYDVGFSLADGVFRPVYWHVLDANASIDYSSPVFGGEYRRLKSEVSSNQPAPSGSEASSDATKTSASAKVTENKKDSAKKLPSTGEKMSVLIYPALALGLLAIGLLARAMLKKKSNKS